MQVQIDLYNILATAEILAVTNCTNAGYCDVLFEVQNNNENALRLITHTLKCNNDSGHYVIAGILEVLSQRQFELKNLGPNSYIRLFLERDYLKSMHGYVDEYEPRSLEEYEITKTKLD